MDVLKQKLNDIGSCIGYPFYFFEDGSFSHTFVCGKMNACLVVKGAFAESDKCFFASAKEAKSPEIKVTEKKWTQKSVVPSTVNWFKKYLNDIGRAINYPFYVFDDGAYSKTSVLDDKQAVLYVKQPFTSVEGESTFFSTDSRKVSRFNENLKKLKKQQNDRKDIVFRMLAGEQVSDEEALQVVENETHDVVKRCVHSVWKKIGCYWEVANTYPKSFAGLVKKNWWDIYCFDKQEFKYFCLCEVEREHFFPLFFQYATPEILEKMLRLCLKRMFFSKVAEKYASFERDFAMADMSSYRERTAEAFRPLYLIQRRDAEAYRVYRKYLGRQYWMCERGYGFREYRYYFGSLDLHFDEEFDAIVARGDRVWFKILLKGKCLSNEQKAKLIRTGNIEMIRVYTECCGIDEKFLELLMYSGNDELVKLASQPELIILNVSQEDMASKKSGGLFQKIRNFFGATA